MALLVFWWLCLTTRKMILLCDRATRKCANHWVMYWSPFVIWGRMCWERMSAACPLDLTAELLWQPMHNWSAQDVGTACPWWLCLTMRKIILLCDQATRKCANHWVMYWSPFVKWSLLAMRRLECGRTFTIDSGRMLQLDSLTGHNPSE